MKHHTTRNKATGRWGLPLHVQFCKRCVISNQRPSSVVETRNAKDSAHPTIVFDENGICDACNYAYMKHHVIDWKKREQELLKLLKKFRHRDGSYDCIVPGSGGKDSIFASHLLKFKYGMHPLTITWPPHIYTDVGWRNFQHWIHAGFDNVMFTPNGKEHRTLTRLAFLNLRHTFLPFIIGQKNLALLTSVKFGIPLVFYGEPEAEYGNRKEEAFSPQKKLPLNQKQEYFGGVHIKDLPKHGVTPTDLQPYLLPSASTLKKTGTDVRYLAYYIKWIPQKGYS